ncbi:RdRP-domain-containing protein [Cylindrobasidium torrendii FP15055 ss-10]|uniref:RNA-dependent RNA polymerase n=1 Tax=Cylindrobasidium torrendii FP15055 ss-10 TaxID=1314674 RepID=A0A0D7B835_9AGAR|nr:RdRP-domain-containing protein [Cylindrobasidium torrendii FP15055 ss-10]
MQIFMRGIPVQCSKDEINIKLARHIHRPPVNPPGSPPLNFDVFLLRVTPNRNGGRQRFRCGLLTFPDSASGNTFLDTYRGGIPFVADGSRVQFSLSNRAPDPALVDRLAQHSWRDPEARRRAVERAQDSSAPIHLHSFAFGRFCRDGTFSQEATVAEGASATISCDIQHRRLKLTTEGHLFLPPIVAWYRAPQIVSICAAAEAGYVIIEANAFPVFEEAPTVDSDDPYGIEDIIHNVRPTPAQRAASIYGNSSMPPVGRFLYVQFRDIESLNLFLVRCRDMHVHRVRYVQIPVQSRGLFGEEVDEHFQNVLARLDIPLAFELEKAVLSGVLDPAEVIGLQDVVFRMHYSNRVEAPQILRWFLERIPAPSLTNTANMSLSAARQHFVATERRRKTRRQRGRQGRERQQRQQRQQAAEAANTPEPTLTDLLELAITAYSPETPRSRPFVASTAAIYQSYHVILTPSSRILEGPLPDQSSSILRRFGNNDNFIRVSFQDDNRVTLRQDLTLSLSIKDLLQTRYKGALTQGIQVAGRTYEFLGYSMSGLKQHCVVFVHPFAFNTATGPTLMSAEEIRRTLGDFTRIIRKPALLAARWAQAFSASAPSIQLRPEEVRRIPDRMSASRNLFTDGCSTISPAMNRAIWANYNEGTSVNARRMPSCYQIRIGGAKGIIFEDNTLQGKILTLRPSQTKFETDNALTVDIANTSARPIAMFLNRPLTMLLEHLGVQRDTFIGLQDDAIDNVDAIRTSFKAASKLFQQHGLGTSYRLPSLFNNLVRQLGMRDSDIIADRLQCDLLATVISYAATHVLRELKFRGRIPVPGSWTLIGVSDEWDCLAEGEIYAHVRNDRTGLNDRITGRVLITRSPQIHPGDVQFVNAVDRPQLRHLKNVVVFSCRGNRSLASCLGGGDLDGDIFNIIRNIDLFPTRTVEAGSYIGLPHKETEDPCTVADVADFVIDFLEADLVGMIANRHLTIADTNERGPESDECLQLAELASHAVDFPKTGTPVDFTKIPRAPNRYKPDFLATELVDATDPDSSYYRSTKVLGVLFRRVPLREEDPGNNFPYFGLIQEALEDLDTESLGLPDIDDVEESLFHEMGELLELYKTEFRQIAKEHTLSKHPNDMISEAEILSGTIQAKWADHRKRRDAVTAMNLQTQQLAKGIRKELRRTLVVEDDDATVDGIDEDEDDEEALSDRDIATFERAAAAWDVALADVLDDDEEGEVSFGSASFGIVALGVMLDIAKKARQ